MEVSAKTEEGGASAEDVIYQRESSLDVQITISKGGSAPSRTELLVRDLSHVGLDAPLHALHSGEVSNPYG